MNHQIDEKWSKIEFGFARKLESVFPLLFQSCWATNDLPITQGPRGEVLLVWNVSGLL